MVAEKKWLSNVGGQMLSIVVSLRLARTLVEGSHPSPNGKSESLCRVWD